MKLDELDDRHQFGFLISDVARLLRWNFDRQAQDLGLTRAQWAVLAHLKRSDGVHQNTLAKLMDIKPITLVRHVDRLEGKGWVERRPDPNDRRAKCLYLTPRANPMLESLAKLGQKVRQGALKDIDPRAIALTLETLENIKANLSAAHGDGA